MTCLSLPLTRIQILKRSSRKKEATTDLKEALELGDEETAAKLVKRTVKVTQKQNEECKRLLRLMGIPVIEAPSEAEAQCVELVRANKAMAVTSYFSSLSLLVSYLLTASQSQVFLSSSLSSTYLSFRTCMSFFDTQLCIPLLGCSPLRVSC